MSWFCYIVECRDGSWYTGTASDVKRRIEEHNSGSRGAKYTRSRRPVRLRYSAECQDRAAACRMEAYIKGLTRPDKEWYVVQEEYRLKRKS